MTHEFNSDPDLAQLEVRLEAERPVPRAAFRGELQRRLAAQGASRPATRRLRLLITAYAGSGAALLAIAVVGVVGAGPFAA